uniref:Uncharacterized protein n=1 Tax=Trichuris muris TaxID=70415 RepID=A0A5S6R2K7_TRIMR
MRNGPSARPVSLSLSAAGLLPDISVVDNRRVCQKGWQASKRDNATKNANYDSLREPYPKGRQRRQIVKDGHRRRMSSGAALSKVRRSDDAIRAIDRGRRAP